MSRAVKVEDKVYEELDSMRGKGETFSQVIANLISMRVTIFNVLNVLEGQVQFNEWKAKRLRELEEAVARRETHSEDFKHGPEKIRDLQVR